MYTSEIDNLNNHPNLQNYTVKEFINKKNILLQCNECNTVVKTTYYDINKLISPKICATCSKNNIISEIESHNYVVKYFKNTENIDIICKNCSANKKVSIHNLRAVDFRCSSCPVPKNSYTPDWYDGNINDEFKGLGDRYYFISGCGHKVSKKMTYKNFLTNYKDKCDICSNPDKYKPPEWFDTSINTKYNKAGDKYNFKASCGHIVNCTISNFNIRYKDGVCNDCKTPEWFDKTLNPNGYKGRGFIGNWELYNFRSNCGHIVNCTVSRWYNEAQNKCDDCNVPSWFDAKLNPEGYKGTVGQNYKFKCNNCGKIFITNNLGINRYYSETCPSCKDYNKSSIELSMIEFLNTLDIKYNYSDWDTLGNGKELDFCIPSHNLAIEMNGIYWHSEKFKHKNYHLEKTKICEEKGINLLHINEDEWMHPIKQSIWKSMISGKLSINRKLGARKTTIVEVPLKQAQNFINENHLQGYAGARYKIGLEFQDELVAIMTFSKSRYSNQDAWEVVRFASRQGINVQGGFSKLLKYFNSVYNRDKLQVLSYADRRHSQGNVYEKNGFIFSHYSSPGYKYFKGHNIVLESRERYMKHKLPDLLETFDPNLTEYENMKLNGYERIWDSGNSIWIYEVS